MSECKIYIDENHKYSSEKTEFDTTKDYQKEYANVYFRVNSKHYNYSNNYNCTQKEKENFKNELKEIFTSLGWEYIASSRYSVADKAKKDNQSLYLHPQNFSGTVLKNEIGLIHKTLQNRNTFTLRYTDVFETIYDMNDNDYAQYLSTKTEEIKDKLLKCFKTSRTNLFVTVNYSVIQTVFDSIKLRRLSDKDRQVNNVEFDLFESILNELLIKGYLVKAETRRGIGYRTINKTEQKKLKLNITS